MSTQLQQTVYRFTDKSASYRGVKQYQENLDLNLDKKRGTYQDQGCVT